MRIGMRHGAVGLVSASLILSVVGSASAQDDQSGWPFTGTLKDGSTFTLAQSIADKITDGTPTSGQPINYLFSYQSSSIPLFSQQYQAGHERGVRWAQTMMAINDTITAPPAPATNRNAHVVI